MTTTHPAFPVASTPSALPCDVCGHYALDETPLPNRGREIDGHERLACGLCGAHHTLEHHPPDTRVV